MIKKVEQLCASFLWKGEASTAAGAKVNWLQVCRPKTEGGLGIRSLLVWNKACFARISWKLFSGTKSLWIAWVKVHLIRGRSFWVLKANVNFS